MPTQILHTCHICDEENNTTFCCIPFIRENGHRFVVEYCRQCLPPDRMDEYEAISVNEAKMFLDNYIYQK